MPRPPTRVSRPWRKASKITGRSSARDALAGVLDLQHRLLALDAQAHRHPAAGRRELQRVGDEVAGDLLQARAVAPQRQRLGRQRRAQREALELGGFLEGLDRAAHRIAQVQRLEPQRELAVHDAREVEQVVHQPHLLADVAVNRLQRALRQLVQAAVAAQDLGPAEDRLQRRAQLVGQRRDELVLQAIGGLGRLARGLQLGARPLLLGHVLPGDQHRLDGAVGPAQRIARWPGADGGR